MDQQTTERMKSEWQREFARFEARQHPEDFPRLPEMPAARYTDPRFHQLEMQYFWPKVWLFAGHVNDVPEPGSYVLWRNSGVPIVIVRGKDNQIRAFYNTCQHRGGPLVTEEAGKSHMLVCKYHCWTYDLEGHLRFMPDAHEFPDFDKSTRSLVPVRCELWGNLIFINRDPNAVPLLEALGPLVREFSDFKPDKLNVFAKFSFDIEANWKVAIDTFQEVYHIKQVHPHTINDYLDYRAAVFTLYQGGHSRLVLPMHSGERGANAQVLDTGGRTTGDPAHIITREGNRSYTIFPNIVTPTAEFQFPLLVFWPTGPRTSRMDVIYLAPAGHDNPNALPNQQVVMGFNAVMDEDLGMMNAMRESMETDAFRNIQLGYTERRIYQHHEQIDRVIGLDKLPPELAMQPIMQRFAEDW
jgi:phenylpropionate dioxygenase-like ring-hydroxylating dioxygenase large terminal subunit